ncbi:hypothetical protein BKA67DRAFT_539471 [Truncatella angustata]|uniref:Protein kinase domain-containing protein n=1 Tax=Truncatella angustata TaxID=152316 RepID=A0A9P8RKA2_9PEZI|nr:uncharacterized protein BKA67DRAFT_539471 [Truncatella angustata]KAH6647621.1 hypothetical protein BKA67DRAFT_539471 [Truncatella angustata]
MATPQEPTFEVDTERLEHDAAKKRSLKYEFVTEKSPGTWIVSRKRDRFEFLARDETDLLQDAVGQLTPFGHVLSPDEHDMNIMEPIMRIFNHENLINFVDWIQIQTTETATISGGPPRQFFIWDFCNAGTLENLFFAERHTSRSSLHDDQLQREAADGLPSSQREWTGFLPEAFCWHVVVSVLRALAWLHHGLREDWDCTRNAWVVKGANIDWHTILHRNIRPDNIFFCHPQTKFETYGLCKLANFSNAFVSGVFNGVLDVVPPASTQKVLAPPSQTGKQSSYAELRDLDSHQDTTSGYADAIYTITSEYRALADVIVAMMIPPETHSEALRHFTYTKTLPEQQWQRQLADAPYTKVLKNFVHELYRIEEPRANNTSVITAADQHNTFERDKTFTLYRKARDLYDKFRIVKDEGKDVVTADHVRGIQDRRDREAEAKHARQEQRKKDLLEHFKTSNRFNDDAEEPTSMDLLLQEISEVVDEVRNTTAETHFRPGMVH